MGEMLVEDLLADLKAVGWAVSRDYDRLAMCGIKLETGSAFALAKPARRDDYRLVATDGQSLALTNPDRTSCPPAGTL